MNTGELLTRVRGRLADDVGASADSLWSDAELIGDYANESRTSMFRRTRWMVMDSTTATDLELIPLCRIPVIAATASYAVSPKILSIERVMLSTGTQPLIRQSREQLDAINPNWQTITGEPWAYCPDMDTDKLVFHPIPVANATASLSNYRFPLAPLSHLTPNAPLGFDEEFHSTLIFGIMELALQKWDAESQKAPLGLAYGQRFESKCEDIKDELLRRKPRHHSNRLNRAFISG